MPSLAELLAEVTAMKTRASEVEAATLPPFVQNAVAQLLLRVAGKKPPRDGRVSTWFATMKSERPDNYWNLVKILAANGVEDKKAIEEFLVAADKVVNDSHVVLAKNVQKAYHFLDTNSELREQLPFEWKVVQMAKELDPLLVATRDSP